MPNKKYSYTVIDDKSKAVLDSGEFESWEDKFKVPSTTRPLYKSHTVFTIFDNTGSIVKQEIRKQLVSELPKYILCSGGYEINKNWEYIHDWILEQSEWSGQTYEDILNPDFQRGRVWTLEQQITYIEHVIKGGKSGKDIYFNCPTWHVSTSKDRNIYCVDGLQRITAVLAFLNNDFKIFDEFYAKDLEKMYSMICAFNLHVLDFQTRDEVLEFYLQLNDSGTPHTEEELQRVRELKTK